MEDQNRNNIWEQRTCPLCSSNLISGKPEVKATSPAEKLSWEQVKDAFIGIRNDQVFFSYYRCTECELLYCPWYFTKSQLDILYSEMPDNTMGEDKRTASKTQSRYARKIIALSGKRETFLEIGPDIGLVAKEIVSLAQVKTAIMVEPNEAVHDELLSNISKSDNQEICTDITKLSQDKFDLAVGIHVLDHLILPKDDLNFISKNAKRGQVAAFVVHNEKSILRKLMKEKWPPFCLQHPQLYNKKSMTKIMQESGFSGIRFSKTINYYHLNNLFAMLFSILNLPKFLNKFIPAIEMPLFLGNIMVTAHKE